MHLNAQTNKIHHAFSYQKECLNAVILAVYVQLTLPHSTYICRLVLLTNIGLIVVILQPERTPTL